MYWFVCCPGMPSCCIKFNNIKKKFEYIVESNRDSSGDLQNAVISSILPSSEVIKQDQPNEDNDFAKAIKILMNNNKTLSSNASGNVSLIPMLGTNLLRKILSPNPIHGNFGLMLPPYSHMKLSSENSTKKNVMDIYKKIANDFETLQQCLDTAKSDKNQTVSASPPKAESKNVIMIENVKKNGGNCTRITLVRRKLCQRVREIKLPTGCNSSPTNNNLKLKINNRDSESDYSLDGV